MDTLHTNIIIATNVKTPNREGFIKIHQSLNLIKDKLERLTKQPWLIRLNLQFASDQVKQAFADLQRAAGSQEVKLASSLPIAKSLPTATPLGTRTKRTVVPGEEGNTVRVLTEAQVIHENIQATVKTTTDEANNLKKQEVEIADLANKAKVAYDKTLAVRKEMFQILQQETKGKREGEFQDKNIEKRLLQRRRIFSETANRVKELKKEGFTGGQSAFSESVISSNLTGEFARVRDLTKTYVKDLENGYLAVQKVNFATGKITPSIIQNTEYTKKKLEADREINKEQAARLKQQRQIERFYTKQAVTQAELREEAARTAREQERGAAAARRLDATQGVSRKSIRPTRRTIIDPESLSPREVTGQIITYVKQLKDGREILIDYNSLTGKISAGTRKSAEQAREISKANSKAAAAKRKELSEQEKQDRLIARSHIRQQEALKEYNALLEKRSKAFGTYNRLLRLSKSDDPAFAFKGSKPVFGTEPDPTGGTRRVEGRQFSFVEQLDDGKEVLYKINTLTGDVVAQQRESVLQAKQKAEEDRKSAKYLAEQQKQEARIARAYVQQQLAAQERQTALENQAVRAKAVNNEITKLRQLGARTTSSKFILDEAGQLQEQVRLVRFLGGGFRDFTVEVTRANAASGVLNQEILRGSDAMRAYGDSFFVGAQKVALWLGITSAAFAAMRTFQYGAQVIRELNSNTVLLARVLDFTGESFEQAERKAERLTKEITTLSVAIGGSVVESQKAAVVFARAFKDERTILQGVTASLLAARIAELEVADAAELLAAATLQFKLRGDELINTLDGLNTLSNNYRVTTQDLLDAISRAGSVYAEHQGQLESLAAITAVVSQVTGRTGSQIGNALKTVVSRLDRLEVQQKIFEELGLSINTAEGESRDFLSTLIELEAAMSTINQTTKRELELSQAGVRQRNILSAATANIEEALRAYIKASQDTQSSTEELLQQTSTLDAAYQRLQSSFESALVSSRGSFIGILSTIADVVRLILELNNSTGGYLLTGGALIGIFVLLQTSLAKVIPAGIAYAQVLGQITVASYRTAAGQATLTQSFNMTANAANNSSGAVATAAAGTLKMNAISAGAALAMIGLSYAIAQSSKRLQDWQIETDRVANASDRAIAAAEKRIRTIDNLGEALIRLKIREKIAREAGDKERADAFRKRAEFVASQTRIINTELGAPEEDPAEIARKKIAAIEKERQGIISLREEKLKSLKEERGRLSGEITYARTVARVNAETRKRYANAGLPNVGEALELGANYVLALEDAEARYKAVKEEIALTEAEVVKLKTGLANTVAEQEKAIRATDRLRTTIEDWRETQSEFKVQDFIDGITGTNDTMDKFRAKAKQAGDAAELFRQDLETLELVSPSLAEKVRKFAEEANDVRDQVRQDAIKFRRESTVGFFGDSFKRSSELRLSAAKAAAEYNRRVNNLSEGLDPTADIVNRRSFFAGEIRRAQQRLSNLPEADRLNDEEKLRNAAEADALRQQTAENLASLRDLELQYSQSLLEVDKKIAIERIKQADEAQRALGILSEEDKLRLRAQASFFAKNPNAQIGIQQQFLASADTNRIAQQFYNGRLQTFNESLQVGNPFARSLAAGGFGSDPELIRLQRERGALGLNGPAEREQALRNAEEYDLQRRRLLGEDPFIGANFNNEFGRDPGAVNNQNGINVNLGRLDLAPLVAALQEGFKNEVQREADVLREEFQQFRAAREAARPKRLNAN